MPINPMFDLNKVGLPHCKIATNKKKVEHILDLSRLLHYEQQVERHCLGEMQLQECVASEEIPRAPQQPDKVYVNDYYYP
ncbi:hypothetical protein TNCV_1882181 [Trichonephila clavipes]|nr:hypothetical protein TNCV_1882181 [Trichonephila clavipes]